MRRAILSLMLWAMCWLSAIAPARPARAQAALPPCYQRPLQVENTKPIWVENKRFCVERVIALPPGEDDALALTALAFGDDGALYATAPLRGEVWRFVDGDGDDLPDTNTARVILSGLRRPNALAWLDGALYVVASAEFLRWEADGTAQTLVDDLPTGGGYWNGGLAFDGEGNAYVGSGAPCAVCAARALESANPRASILRIPAAGTWEVYATGIRQPAGLAWAAGALWTTDIANDGQPDELNRIIPGGDYGWPACVSGAPACAESLPPALTLPPGSVPLALLRYEGAAFPELVGSLLLALAGEPNAPLGESGFLARCRITGGNGCSARSGISRAAMAGTKRRSTRENRPAQHGHLAATDLWHRHRRARLDLFQPQRRADIRAAAALASPHAKPMR